MTALVFSRNFDAEIAAERACFAVDGPRTHSDAEMAAAVAAARAEGHACGLATGHAAGLAEAEARTAERTAQSLEALQPVLRDFADRTGAHHRALEAQAAGFALAVCEKVFPAFLARTAQAHAEAEIAALVARGLDVPELAIRVAPEVAGDLGARLPELAAAGNPGCRITVEPDPALAPGDATIRWANGCLETSYRGLCAAILTGLRQTAATLATPMPE